jgi:hypothetical protein
MRERTVSGRGRSVEIRRWMSVGNNKGEGDRAKGKEPKGAAVDALDFRPAVAGHQNFWPPAGRELAEARTRAAPASRPLPYPGSRSGLDGPGGRARWAARCLVAERMSDPRGSVRSIGRGRGRDDVRQREAESQGPGEPGGDAFVEPTGLSSPGFSIGCFSVVGTCAAISTRASKATVDVARFSRLERGRHGCVHETDPDLVAPRE